MMGIYKMIGHVITQVMCSRFPVNDELLLIYYVTYPIKPHVQIFGTIMFYVSVCYVLGSGVFKVHCGGRLGVIHVFKSGSYWNGFLTVEEEGTHLGFFCGCHFFSISCR